MIINSKPWRFFLLYKNNNAFWFALALTLSLTASLYCSKAFLQPVLRDIFWPVVAGAFLGFYRLGNTKYQQMSCITVFAGLTIAMLTILLISSHLPSLYYQAIKYILIFLSLSIRRYIKSGKTISITLVLFILLFNYIYYPANSLPFILILQSILIGFTIGWASTMIMTLVLPRIHSEISAIDKNPYIIKQALRITLVLIVGYLVSKYFHLTRSFWVMISILLINEADLHLTQRKGIERLLGTIAGGLLSIVIAPLIFKSDCLLPYLCFLLVFLTAYFSLIRYMIALFFGTLIIAGLYYLLHPPTDILHFMIYRIEDTAIGVALAIIGEYTIFPLWNKRGSIH